MMGDRNWPIRAGALLLCLAVAAEAVAAERTVARMGQLRASVAASNWCGPVVRVDVEAPSGVALDANTREMQLLVGGVRQILSLECAGVQELELTGVSGGQVMGHWRQRGDGQLVAMAPPATGVSSAQPGSSPATTADVAQAQRLLAELGYQPGPADGLIGQRTRSAIAAFRRDRQLGHGDAVNAEVLAQLRLARCGNPASCDPAAMASGSGSFTTFPANPSSTGTLSPGPLTTGPSSTGPLPTESLAGAGTSVPAPAPASSHSALVAPALPGAAPVGGVAQAPVVAAEPVEASAATPMPVSHDYQAMAARLGLRTLKGVPVLTGSSGVLSEEQAKASVRLLDLAALGAIPEHVESEPQCWAESYLDEAVQGAYLDDGYAMGMGAWRGSNEFERARAREAFIDQHAERLRAQAVAFPLEFMIVQKTRLQGYDQEAGGFPLRGIASPINGLGNLAELLRAGRQRPACAISSLAVTPPAVAVPDVWRMPPERAEQVLQRLNERDIHVAIGVRMRVMPMTDEVDPRLGTRRIPVWAEVTSIAAYEDPDLERLVEDFGLATAAPPVMMTGLPKAPSLPEEVTLDAESLALVMLRDHGDVLSDTAWLQMLRRQAHADEAYYNQLFLRDTGHDEHDFDPRYTPFFAKGYRYRHGEDMTNEQMALFKAWTQLRASRLPEALNLRVGIREQRDHPTAIALSVMQERHDTARLVEWLGEHGYSTHQVLLPDVDPLGVNEEFDPAIMAGPNVKRRPFVILPNLVSRYAPAFSQEEVERILGGSSGRHVMELALRIDGSEFVTLDDRTEALVLNSEPVRLFSHDREGKEIVYRHEYAVPALAGERQEVASPNVVTAPEGPLPLSAEVMDLLMVRHVPDAVSDEDYLQMLEARWVYEDSMPLDGAEPDWGRFFVPGRAKPDETQFAERLADFKAWTLARAEAMPETFTLYQRHVNPEPDTPIDILGSRTLRFDPMELMYPRMEVRSCHNSARNLEALTQACDFLDSALQDTPSIYPLGVGHQLDGPRVRCGMALHLGSLRDPKMTYCKARRELYEKVGTNNVEPGFRDVLVLDKEVLFTGTPEQAAADNALIEFAVRDVRLEAEPLPSGFVEAIRHIMDYQRGLGWDENRWFKSSNSIVREMLSGTREPPKASRFFVFELEVIEADLVNGNSGERFGGLTLREPSAIDFAALEIPDAQALASAPEAPYGEDVLGIRIGMGIEEAEAIVREHMRVGQVLVSDRKLDPRFASGEFDAFSSSRVFVAEDMSEMIVLYDEPPAAEGVVMGVTRQLAFPKGQVTIGMLLGELRKKYGEENWSDQNRLKVGWGPGFANARPTDTYSHPCFPGMRQMPSNGRGQWQWTLEDGSPADSVTTPSGRALSIPGMTMSGMHDLEGRECGVSLVLDSSSPGDDAETFVLHLTDPNRYARLFKRSQEIVKSGESGAGGDTEAASLEIKL